MSALWVPVPYRTLVFPFPKKLGGANFRVAKPCFFELEPCFRQPSVGNPFAPRRGETQHHRPTSGRRTIAISRRKRNRKLRSANGNISCIHCNCDLYDKTFSSCPTKFRTPALHLANGMLVHHFVWCQDHLSVWFCRRGVRHYQVYYGNKAYNLYNHIHAARAASGKPGGHASTKQILSNFFCPPWAG